MKLTIYAFRDLKAQCFRPISCDLMTPEQMAVNFSRALASDASQASKYDGLQLCALGEFDDVTGAIEPYASPRVVVDCDFQIEASKKATKEVKDDGKED